MFRCCVAFLERKAPQHVACLVLNWKRGIQNNNTRKMFLCTDRERVGLAAKTKANSRPRNPLAPRTRLMMGWCDWTSRTTRYHREASWSSHRRSRTTIAWKSCVWTAIGTLCARLCTFTKSMTVPPGACVFLAWHQKHQRPVGAHATDVSPQENRGASNSFWTRARSEKYVFLWLTPYRPRITRLRENGSREQGVAWRGERLPPRNSAPGRPSDSTSPERRVFTHHQRCRDSESWKLGKKCLHACCTILDT